MNWTQFPAIEFFRKTSRVEREVEVTFGACDGPFSREMENEQEGRTRAAQTVRTTQEALSTSRARATGFAE